MIESTGPTQCQDGVTNNCTQECSRNVTNGVHECSCRPGYEFALGSNSICEGSTHIKDNNNCYHRVHMHLCIYTTQLMINYCMVQIKAMRQA